MKRVTMFFALLLALAMTQSAQAQSCGPSYGNVIGLVDGENVYSNGENCSGKGSGIYQCVELVRRYFHDIFGTNLSHHDYAYQFFTDTAGDTNIVRYGNGSTVIPQDGDGIVFSYPNSAGHIAVVAKRTVNTVTICHQNWSYKTGCMDLAMSLSPSGAVTIDGPGSYVTLGWIRAVVNGRPVPPPSGGGGDPPPQTPPPTFGYTRAFPTGAGTLNPYAWERGRLDFGGSDIGVAVESPRWESGYVVQRHRRVTDAVDSIMVHNQDHGAARAFPIIDAFYKAFLQFGGLSRLGAPISKKYQTSPTSWRQDFQYSYIVINDGQAAINYPYPSGYTPGQGSSEKQMFETAYGDLSGTNNIGNPSSGVNVSSGLEWQTYTTPTGATSKLVAIPSGYFRAFQIKSGIEKVLNANGGVAVFGPPISDEFDIGNNQTRQYFRFGTFTHNSITYTTTFVKTARQYAPGETVSPVTSALYLRDAFERNGSYAKLGICTAPYYGAGHVYQYCSGGSSSGRAAVILNPSAGNYVAFVVRAGIESYYMSVGGITGVMGTPVSDEWIPNGGYTFQDFGHKTMQWYNYGPHVADYVYQVTIGEGAGFPTAFHFMWNLDAVHLGQPLNAAHWWHNRSGTSVLQDYEGGTYTGTVTFVHNEPDRAPRAFELRGGVRTTYFNMGGPDSYLGRPISDEVSRGTTTRQYFEGGYIGGDTSAAVYTATRY